MGSAVHKYVAAGVVALCLSPVLLLVSPLILSVVVVGVFGNALRATRWNIRRCATLLRLVWSEVVAMVTVYIPTMLRVLWYYVMKSDTDHVRCDIPYETYYRGWMRRYRTLSSLHPSHSPQQGAASPPNDSISTHTHGSSSSTASSPMHTALSSRNVSFTHISQVATAVDGGATTAKQPFFRPKAERLQFPSKRRREALRGIVGTAGSSGCCLDVYAHDAHRSSHTKFSEEECLVPVVVFFYGGAWGSGKKWYYSTLAANLRNASDCVVVVPDYPAGTIVDMTESVHAVLQWVADHIALYGGDRHRITVVGHSAGANLLALWMLRRALARSEVRWSLQDSDSAGSSSVIGGSRRADAVRYADVVRLMKTVGHPCMPSHAASRAPPISLFSVLDGVSELASCFCRCLWRRRDRSAAAVTKEAAELRCCPVDDVGVDFSTGPEVDDVLLFSGPFDLVRHFGWEEGRCVEEVSTMRGATNGYWEASSPTRILSCLGGLSDGDAKVEEVAVHTKALLRRTDFGIRGAVRIYHDPDDRTVSIEQSEAFREALLRCIETDAADVDAVSLCPNVIRFPHGHGDLVVGPMRLGPVGEGEPLIQEIRRCVCVQQGA